MAYPVVGSNGNEITVYGGLFDTDVRRQLNANMGRHVRHLIDLGAKTAKERLAARGRGTGFTEDLVETYQKFDGSLYGKVRYRPGETREPGSAKYPASRRPYIVAAVIETGRYGGTHVTKLTIGRKARTRRRWQTGYRRGPKATFQMRYAARVVRAEAKNIRDSLLTEGL